MGRVVIGGAAGWCGHQNAVTGKFLDLDIAVDGYLYLRRLPTFAKQGNLIDSEGFDLLSMHVHRHHSQRMKLCNLAGFKPFDQVGFLIFVEQKPDRALVHAIDGGAGTHEGMHGFQHKSVAAKGDNHIGFSCGNMAIAFDQGFFRRLRIFRFAGRKINLHPPLAARHAHVAGHRRPVIGISVDDKIMALGFAADGLINCRIKGSKTIFAA